MLPAPTAVGSLDRVKSSPVEGQWYLCPVLSPLHGFGGGGLCQRLWAGLLVAPVT